MSETLMIVMGVIIVVSLVVFAAAWIFLPEWMGMSRGRTQNSKSKADRG
jgi:hypothetical protein